MKLRVKYLPTKYEEVVKFYILPIDRHILLGGDWLCGNNCYIYYASSSLYHCGLHSNFRLPLVYNNIS